MTFPELMAQVEAILLNPDATKDDLERAKDLAESVNLLDQDNPACDDDEDEDEEDEKEGDQGKEGSRDG